MKRILFILLFMFCLFSVYPQDPEVKKNVYQRDGNYTVLTVVSNENPSSGSIIGFLGVHGDDTIYYSLKNVGGELSAILEASVPLTVKADTIEFFDGTKQMTAAGTADEDFDGNRPIQYVPQVGQNLGTSTKTDWLESWYFSPPTMTCLLNGTTSIIREVGTSTTITISGATTLHGGEGTIVLSSGQVIESYQGVGIIHSFTSYLTYTKDITYTPLQTPTVDYTKRRYDFRAQQNWVFGTKNGTAASTTRIMVSYFATFDGVTVVPFDENTTGTTIWTAFSSTRRILPPAPGSYISAEFDAEGQYICFVFPTEAGVISQILNESSFDEINGFDIFTGVTGIDVSSVGLTNNYINQAYTLVQSKLPKYGMVDYVYRFYFE